MCIPCKERGSWCEESGLGEDPGGAPGLREDPGGSVGPREGSWLER